MKKKIAMMMFSVLAVVIMAVSLTACGAVGTYKLTELTVYANGEAHTAKAGEDLLLENGNWIYPVNEDDVVLTLKNNGIYTTKMMFPGMTEPEFWRGYWREKDGTIIILNDYDEVTATFAVDGNQIVWELEGFYKIVLKK